MNTGIVVAVPQEAEEILNDSSWHWHEKEPQIYHSAKKNCTLAVSGVGKVYAAYALMKVESGCDCILSVGTSASLTGHDVGEIVLCREFVEHDMDVTGIGVPHGVTPFCDMKSSIIHTEGKQSIEESIAAYCTQKGIVHSYGRSMSGDMFLNTKEIVEQKYEQFKADIADMETASLAKICAFKLMKPCIAVRYISDRADDESSTVWIDEVRKASVIFNDMLKQIL